MWKKSAVILSSVLVCLLFTIVPTQAQVSVQNSEESTIESTYTRTVTQSKVYSVFQSIPSSIHYNSGGWQGTLYLTSAIPSGGIYFAIFSGSVSCSGNCPIPTKLDEQY